MLSRFLGAKKAFFLLRASLIGTIALALSSLGAIADLLSLKTFQSYSRIVLAVDPTIPAELESSATGFKVRFKGVSLLELGLSKNASYFGIKDPRVKQLEIKEVGRNVEVTGKWAFPTGNERLARPEMEVFQYRSQNPFALHLDLWVKRGPTALEVEQKQRETARQLAEAAAKADAEKRAARRLASERFTAAVEDLSRFCRLPLNEANEVFLPLLPVHSKFPFQRYFSTTTPDTHFVYYEPQIASRDAQYVRLALKLYRDGNFGLTLKTLDFLDKEFPQSPFRLEMRFLRANALIKLGIKGEPEQLLTQLVYDAGGSAIALHTAVYRALKQMEAGSHLAALESFLWLINKYPEHRLMWVFRMGAAEALYAMKQTDRAQKEYQWVAENAPTEAAKSEGALRIGDLFLERFQYDQSLTFYYRAIQSFSGNAEGFPTVHLNRAESLYGLSQYDRAASAYTEFLKKYPAHPAGWRATYRLGEIFGRRSGKENLTASRRWFYETINRYPYSPGTTLARMRLLPCEDHGGFDLASADKFFMEDAARFNGSGEVLMARYREMKALSYVRTLVSFREDKRAIEVAIKELLQLGNIPTRPILGNLLNAVFRKYVLELLNSGDKYGALAFYRKHADTIPKAHAGPVSPDYVLKLSQAASDLGLGALALSLNQSYKTQLAFRSKATSTRSLASEFSKNSTASGESLDVTQIKAPPLEEGEAKLRQGEEKFTEAKGLWKSKGLQERAKIKELLSSVGEESRFSFERELILGRIVESEKNPTEALRHAVAAQLLEPAHDPKGGVPKSIRLHSWIAQLTAEAGDPEVALETLRKLEGRLRGMKKGQADDPAEHAVRVIGLPAPLTLEQTLFYQVDLLEKKNAWNEAVKVYEKLTSESLGGNHARFGLARALLRVGDQEQKTRAFEELEALAKYVPPANPNGVASPPHPDVASGKVKVDFWNRLAREAISNEQSRQSLKPENAKEGKP
jgi:tetratricopeptide (TPR) repeat protein